MSKKIRVRLLSRQQSLCTNKFRTLLLFITKKRKKKIQRAFWKYHRRLQQIKPCNCETSANRIFRHHIERHSHINSALWKINLSTNSNLPSHLVDFSFAVNIFTHLRKHLFFYWVEQAVFTYIKFLRINPKLIKGTSTSARNVLNYYIGTIFSSFRRRRKLYRHGKLLHQN